ncbi:hypothetical protein DPMN_105785 [Dreissena polymorpha]|uniref:Uncharacterized protein n=1 Tax=Dreissena polymorpha TaxID=45954 RepID=A0A9D4K3S8_DREPO|nr:hypothetical protein DPMN_105785 [Dreissena polymorpha]
MAKFLSVNESGPASRVHCNIPSQHPPHGTSPMAGSCNSHLEYNYIRAIEVIILGTPHLPPEIVIPNRLDDLQTRGTHVGESASRGSLLSHVHVEKMRQKCRINLEIVLYCFLKIAIRSYNRIIALQFAYRYPTDGWKARQKATCTFPNH